MTRVLPTILKNFLLCFSQKMRLYDLAPLPDVFSGIICSSAVRSSLHLLWIKKQKSKGEEPQTEMANISWAVYFKTLRFAYCTLQLISSELGKRAWAIYLVYIIVSLGIFFEYSSSDLVVKGTVLWYSLCPSILYNVVIGHCQWSHSHAIVPLCCNQ
jgi:hypothetical protein